jgi:hypothetical protein
MRMCQLIEVILATPLENESCYHTLGADHFYIEDGDFKRHLDAYLKCFKK